MGFLDKKNGKNYKLKDLDMNIVRPTFGTLPVGSLNATTYGFTNNEYLIVFETELLQFCNLISKIIAKSIPIQKENDKIGFQFDEKMIVERIEKENIILIRFKELILGFLLTGRATSASQYILESPFNKIADHLRLAMEVFIMGHEYAHILLRHLGDKETQKQILNTNDVFNVIYSWSQELDADVLGLPLMLIALKEEGRRYPDLSYSGAELFFSAYEVIERGKCILKNGTDEFYWRNGKEDGPIGTHPPAERRRDNIRKAIEYQFGTKFLTTSYIIEKITKILWEKTKPELILIYKQLQMSKN